MADAIDDPDEMSRTPSITTIRCPSNKIG